jgi:hypothetical protein
LYFVGKQPVHTLPIISNPGLQLQDGVVPLEKHLLVLYTHA